MPKITYTPRAFSAESRNLIDICNGIISEYQAQGYSLTLRQLYYQCVSRDIIANNIQSYKRLGSIINDARLAGEIDWDAIEDRTRNLHTLPSWRKPSDIIAACASQFRIDKWATQPKRPECWCEKEALAGVFERVCDELQIPLLCCRGYTSQSEMWSAGQRLRGIVDGNQEPIIIHFGDHDPSGIDMTRDIIDRLTLFMGQDVNLSRLALNMDQVRHYNPPPNPAKISDSRAASYIQIHGNESWELDALEPDVLAALVRNYVESVRDDTLWQEAVEREDEHKRLLGVVSSRWNTLTRNL